MSRDSGADQPTQRTVAELLAEYGGSSEKSSRRRRRKAEDPTETAPQEIINRVLSDSGKMRPVKPDEEPPASRRQGGGPPAQQPANQQPAAQQPANQQPAAQQPANQQPAAPPAAQQPVQPPAAPQPPQPPQAQQAPTPPPTPPQAPARPAPEPPAEPGPQPGSAGYWAQRFSSAGGAPSGPPASAQAPSAPSSDAEATIRQPALPQPPARPAGPPVAPAGPPQLPENFTEQLPRIDGGVEQAYPAQAEPEADPYDFDDPEPSFAEGGYEQPYDEPYDQDYDRSAPAGLDEDYDPDEADRPPSAGKEWGTLALQGVAGLIGGGAVWIGFRWLWINATIAAFGAALVFTGLLVLVAWKFFRTNDLQTILLSVLVGLFCTVSPAALLLINQ